MSGGVRGGNREEPSYSIVQRTSSYIAAIWLTVQQGRLCCIDR